MRHWTGTIVLRVACPTFPPAAAIADRSSPPAAALLPRCSGRNGSLQRSRFCEFQTVEPEDLTVIGHVGDLLADIYARNLMHIYILPWCSTPAAAMLNSAGDDAQSQRLRCAILGGILTCRVFDEFNKNWRKSHVARRL